MPLTMRRADFADPRFGAFLGAHLDETEPTAPAESRHALDLSALMATHIRVWVAYDGDDLVGTGALAALDPGHEEVKSMRTDPTRRGQGVAAYVPGAPAGRRPRPRHRSGVAGDGSMDFFVPARSLYARAGFVPCAPFGSYVADPHSVFMTRSLIS
jgi:putative acetyltransferase